MASNIPPVGTAESRLTRTDRDGVAILMLDSPRSMNVVDEPLLEELSRHVQAITSDDAILAVVLASAKNNSFGAGADVRWLPTLEARPDINEYLARVHHLMFRIVESHRPYVSAINGTALGGALELALATEAIVAVPTAQLGLPETSLGLIPGGAGTQLIRRWMSTENSLKLMLSATPLSALEAEKIGLVTEIANADELLHVAVDRARQLATTNRHRGWSVDSLEVARESVRRQLDFGLGRSGEAGKSIIDVIVAGIEGGPELGCAAERTAFIKVLRSSESRALRHLFLSQGAIKRRGRSSGSLIQTLGVVGGGQMGSGIAASAVSRGLRVFLRDISQEKLTASEGYLSKVLERSNSDGPTTAAAKTRLHPTLKWDGFATCDAVIEAVFELADLKTETLTRISELVSPDALIATNTSAIPIHTLANAVTNPERFIGTHFFSPVDRMPFVELVPHAATSPETIRRAAGLVGQLDKTHIVVADRPGFFTSRVYARWLIEGIQLLLDGVDVESIDSAAVSVGFPVGPLQAHDEATLDLVMKASIFQVAQTVMSERLDVSSLSGTLQRLMESGIHGRRQGRGFYLYENGRRVGVNPEVAAVLGKMPSRLSRDDIGARLLLAFATESFLCWDDATLCHPDDGDVASVLAIGFPRTLGGPFRWSDELGAARVLAMCTKYGVETFAPGATLSELAGSSSKFQDATREELPRSIDKIH